MAELNRSASRLCKLTGTVHLQIFAKVSQPATFASNRMLVRVLLDNIVFTAIHDTKHKEVPLLDISIWLDELFAHLEVKQVLAEGVAGSKKNSLSEYFFRSFVYERKYNFGVILVGNALNALKGNMAVSQTGSELLLSIHIPNHADFKSTSSSSQVSLSSHHVKYNQ